MPADPAAGAVVEFLRRQESFSPPSGRVDVIETRLSWIFLTDHHAWKLKKSSKQDGVDFREPLARRHNAEEEVRLNRRLAPDVYLGVVPITREESGRLEMGGAGNPVDWLVQMRRLPAERMLDRLIESKALQRLDIERLVRILAAFYAHVPRADRPPREYVRRLRRGVVADVEALSQPALGLAPALVKEATGVVLGMLRRLRMELKERSRLGWIREVHGDLRPEHVCCLASPVVIDCLEFDRELRLQDPADELAFLALECERLGNPRAGNLILDLTLAALGARPAEDLLAFHRSYRSCRRAWLAARHLCESAAPGLSHWRDRAVWYLERVVERQWIQATPESSWPSREGRAG